MTEIWKDIKDFEGLYQVSSCGRVKSLRDNKGNYREKLLKLILCKGYLYVNLLKDGKQKSYKVHRLVAEAFIPNTLNKPTVNHKDEIKTNNCVENLEWMTIRENCCYGTRNERMAQSKKGIHRSEETKLKLSLSHKGLVAWNKGKFNSTNNKEIIQYDLQGNFIKEFPSTMQIQRELGFDNSSICKVCKGKKKTAYGYIWKYKE